MNNKLSVLIPDGDGSDFPLKVLRCLSQASNIKIYVLSREKWNPIRFSKHHSGFFSHAIDEFDENRLEVILDLTKRLKVDIILPVDQPTIRLLSAHREEVEAITALSLVPTLDKLDIAEDKWLLTHVLKKEDIPFPYTILFQSENPDEHNFTQLSYPVLTKSLNIIGGGTGIKFFNNFSELSVFLKSKECPKRLIIQSFIRGYDLGCSVLCQNGEIKAYTIQKGILPGDRKFAPPSSIEFIQQEQVYKNIEKLMHALNWSGVANIDFRFDEDSNEPKVLEINPRFWGSVIGSLVAGINFPYLACQIGMNMDFPRPEYQLVRYTKPEASFKLLLNKYFSRNTTILKFSETGLPYIISDPLPELQKEFVKISKILFQKHEE